jgi:hypothetical protein
MNDDTSAQLSADLQRRREQLDGLLSYVEARAQDVLRKHGRLHPTLYAISPEGLCLYIAPSLEESEKDAHAENARLICAAHGAVVAVLATEAWVLFAKSGEQADLKTRPSQSPDRKEYVSLIGEALGGTYHNRLLPMLRDNRGRFSCLGKSNVLPPEPVVGRYVSLLPHGPLPQEARAIVNLLLERRGLVIRKEPASR